MIPFIWLLLMIGGGLAIVGFMSWARNYEKRRYNGGTCVSCSSPLRKFDTDSQGARGYVCDCCDHTVWVSYWEIDYAKE